MMEIVKSLKCKVTKEQQKVMDDLMTLYMNKDAFRRDVDLVDFIRAIATKEKSVELRDDVVDLEYEE